MKSTIQLPMNFPCTHILDVGIVNCTYVSYEKTEDAVNSKVNIHYDFSPHQDPKEESFSEKALLPKKISWLEIFTQCNAYSPLVTVQIKANKATKYKQTVNSSYDILTNCFLPIKNV